MPQPMRRDLGLRLLAALAVLCAAVTGPARADDDRTYILATATTGGTYYPVGLAIATVTKTRLAPTHNVALSAISSAGSAENVRLMRDGEAQFALLQGIFGAWAQAGEGPFEAAGPIGSLRAVTAVWPNAEHFTVTADHTDTGTMADMARLKGKRFAIGKRNSGAEQSGRYILSRLGIDPGTLTFIYKGYGPSAESLQNGQVEGMNTPAGVPVSAVTRAFAAAGKRLRLLSFTPGHIEALNADYPLWFAYDIPAGTYPNQNAPVTTVASQNILAVRADVPDEDVYQVTRTLYENLGLLGSIHAATKAMSMETAMDGISLPLHPGAARYFREQGLDVPSPGAD